MLAPLAPRIPAISPSAPGDVAQDHRQPRGAAVRSVAPGQVEPVGVDPAGELVAADDMDLDPLVLAAQPDDAVARDRVAAGGEVEGDARGQPLDRDGGALAERARGDVAAGRSRHQRFHQLVVGHACAARSRIISASASSTLSVLIARLSASAPSGAGSRATISS